LNRIPLEYARLTASVKTRARAALICGLCSGPVGCALMFAAADNTLPEETKEFLGVWILRITLLTAFAFGCIVRLRLPKLAEDRDYLYANIAVAAPLLWGLLIFLVFALAMSGRN
jgi:hypothetical protein